MQGMCSIFVFDFFFFQAEDGIRDAQESRGLGDVYKRQEVGRPVVFTEPGESHKRRSRRMRRRMDSAYPVLGLSLIHI